MPAVNFAGHHMGAGNFLHLFLDAALEQLAECVAVSFALALCDILFKVGKKNRKEGKVGREMPTLMISN